MVRRWKKKSASSEFKVDLPTFPDWTADDQRRQDKMFAQMEYDGLDPSIRSSPHGRPLYGRSPEEILLLALIAGNLKSRGSENGEVAQVRKDWQESLQKVMPLIFGRATIRDDDSEIVYEIVSEIHRRELLHATDKEIPKRGNGSASERAVTKEILLRRNPNFAEDTETLETRMETLRKKVANHYDFYVEHISDHDTYGERKIYLALRDIQERLAHLGIKMDLDALYASDLT